MSLAEQLAARKAKLNVAPKVEPKVDLDPADAQAEVCPSVANLDDVRRHNPAATRGYVAGVFESC